MSAVESQVGPFPGHDDAPPTGEHPLRQVHRASRAILACLAVLVLAAAPGPILAQTGPWPPASDIAPEPGTRTGALANGLRYVVRTNKNPPGAISIRMRIDAGALHEAEADLGIAHFIEHMAFRGTTHVPDGQLDAALSRLGMRRGVDSNAFTSGTQTFFKFDLPKNDAPTLDGALTLLREFASELTLSEAALTEEKGVIESELRFRDTPQERIRQVNMAFQLEGQLAGERYPGGKVEVVRTATAGQLRAFYRAFYRPERTTMIVVGDVEADTVVRALQARFGDWRGQGPAGRDPDLGTPSQRGGAKTISAPDFPPQVTVTWLSPYAPSRTRAQIQANNIDFIALSVVNRRYERAALVSEGRPFAAATLVRNATSRSARQMIMTFAGEPRVWPQALQAIEVIRRQAVEQGVSQAEVDRAVAATEASFRNMNSVAPVQTTPYLADFLLGAVDNGASLATPLALAEIGIEGLKGITAADVNAALKGLFGSGKPYLFMASPNPIPNGDEMLAAVYESAARGQLAAYEAPPPPKDWPFSEFGPRGQVVEQSRIEPLGVTLVRFANGVRLTVKPTDFVKDQIAINAKFGDGRMGLPLDRTSPWWAFQAVVSQGGLKDLTPLDVQTALAASGVNLNFSVLDDGFLFNGATREASLDQQLQLIAANLTAPGWRSETFNNSRRAGQQAITNARTTPAGVLATELPALLRGDDARWRPADAGEVSRTSHQEVRGLLEPAFASSPVQVVIVGDVTVERAIAAVAATLGALPPRPGPSPLPVSAMTLRFPAGGGAALVLVHDGRADQGLAIIAWPVGDFTDLQRPRDLRILETILVQRLTDAIRDEAGAAYGVNSELQVSTVFPGFGYLRLLADVPPEKAALFFDTASRMAARLRTEPITADELERARGPAVQGYLRDRQNNSYWAGQLLDIDTRPMRRDAVLSLFERVQAVTPAGVRTAAGLLTDDKAVRVIIRARSAPGLAEVRTN